MDSQFVLNREYCIIRGWRFLSDVFSYAQEFNRLFECAFDKVGDLRYLCGAADDIYRIVVEKLAAESLGHTAYYADDELWAGLFYML